MRGACNRSAYLRQYCNCSWIDILCSFICILRWDGVIFFSKRVKAVARCTRYSSLGGGDCPFQKAVSRRGGRGFCTSAIERGEAGVSALFRDRHEQFGDGTPPLNAVLVVFVSRPRAPRSVAPSMFVSRQHRRAAHGRNLGGSVEGGALQCRARSACFHRETVLPAEADDSRG